MTTYKYVNTLVKIFMILNSGGGSYGDIVAGGPVVSRVWRHRWDVDKAQEDEIKHLITMLEAAKEFGCQIKDTHRTYKSSHALVTDVQSQVEVEVEDGMKELWHLIRGTMQLLNPSNVRPDSDARKIGMHFGKWMNCQNTEPLPTARLCHVPADMPYHSKVVSTNLGSDRLDLDTSCKGRGKRSVTKVWTGQQGLGKRLFGYAYVEDIQTLQTEIENLGYNYQLTQTNLKNAQAAYESVANFTHDIHQEFESLKVGLQQSLSDMRSYVSHTSDDVTQLKTNLAKITMSEHAYSSWNKLLLSIKSHVQDVNTAWRQGYLALERGHSPIGLIPLDAWRELVMHVNKQVTPCWVPDNFPFTFSAELSYWNAHWDNDHHYWIEVRIPVTCVISSAVIKTGPNAETYLAQSGSDYLNTFTYGELVMLGGLRGTPIPIPVRPLTACKLSGRPLWCEEDTLSDFEIQSSGVWHMGYTKGQLIITQKCENGSTFLAVPAFSAFLYERAGECTYEFDLRAERFPVNVEVKELPGVQIMEHDDWELFLNLSYLQIKQTQLPNLSFIVEEGAFTYNPQLYQQSTPDVWFWGWSYGTGVAVILGLGFSTGMAFLTCVVCLAAKCRADDYEVVPLILSAGEYILLALILIVSLITLVLVYKQWSRSKHGGKKRVVNQLNMNWGYPIDVVLGIRCRKSGKVVGYFEYTHTQLCSPFADWDLSDMDAEITLFNSTHKITEFSIHWNQSKWLYGAHPYMPPSGVRLPSQELKHSSIGKILGGDEAQIMRITIVSDAQVKCLYDHTEILQV